MTTIVSGNTAVFGDIQCVAQQCPSMYVPTNKNCATGIEPQGIECVQNALLAAPILGGTVHAISATWFAFPTIINNQKYSGGLYVIYNLSDFTTDASVNDYIKSFGDASINPEFGILKNYYCQKYPRSTTFCSLQPIQPIPKPVPPPIQPLPFYATNNYTCAGDYCIRSDQGQFKSFYDCLQSGCPSKRNYTCDGRTCLPDQNGKFKDGNECLLNCNPHYACLSGNCVYSDTGIYTTLEDCTNNCTSSSSIIVLLEKYKYYIIGGFVFLLILLLLVR